MYFVVQCINSVLKQGEVVSTELNTLIACDDIIEKKSWMACSGKAEGRG